MADPFNPPPIDALVDRQGEPREFEIALGAEQRPAVGAEQGVGVVLDVVTAAVSGDQFNRVETGLEEAELVDRHDGGGPVVHPRFEGREVGGE